MFSFFSRRHAIPVQTYPLRKIGSSSPVPLRLGGTLDCLARFLFIYLFFLSSGCVRSHLGANGHGGGGCCYSLLGLRRSVSRERGTDFPVDRKDGPNLWFVHVLHRKMIVPGCTRLCFCFRSFLALLSFLFHGLTVHPFYPHFFFLHFRYLPRPFFFLFRLIAIHPFNWLYTLFAISRLSEFV